MLAEDGRRGGATGMMCNDGEKKRLNQQSGVRPPKKTVA